MIPGGEFTEKQKFTIIKQLMEAQSTPNQANRFYIGVNFPGNTDSAGRHMYPYYFIPPYNNGKKYKTVLTQTPQTHILSANMYELEILRLLHLLTRGISEDSLLITDIRCKIDEMISQTLNRLKTTCFGYQDDGVGECFDTSLVVLRFLAAVAPKQTDWINSRIAVFNKHYTEKRRTSFCIWYYWLCLSELPDEIALPQLDTYKEEMYHWLKEKSLVMNSEHDRTIHPILYCILRNNLVRYSEYEYIKNKEPFIHKKDGRLHFDI